MDNVVTVTFDVESEAYKAFAEIRQKPFGDGYRVVEAALLTREGDAIAVKDAIDPAAVTADDTATGMVIGTLVGILGGPVGVLLGAGVGALVGSAYDSADAIDSISMLEVTAAKLFDGEVGIIALVQEDEPAFDAAFEGYETTIARHFAADVAKEVELAREAAADFDNRLRQQLRAERKADKAQKRAERKAQKAEKRAERKENLEEAKDIANAQYTSATKEILGDE
ncbi:MAG: DUF1269 domain-containing protein [Coriobacteriales bacterium]|nr:DUF1269 domain-containing protein [Coriobacteriales bacterium]